MQTSPAGKWVAQVREVGRTSKVHAGVDAKGRPFRLTISCDQLHDSQMMDAFLDWELSSLAIVADKAYGSAKIGLLSQESLD